MDSASHSQTGSDSVRIILRDKKVPQKFLILSEADDPENLKLPGGKFEPHESPVEAAIRELIEEVDLQCSADDLGEPVELLNDDGVSKRFIFALYVEADSLRPTDEITRTAWVDEQSIPEGKNKGHILAAVGSVRN